MLGKEAEDRVAPFVFSPIRLGGELGLPRELMSGADSDDEGLCRDEKVIKQLGSVRVAVHQCVISAPYIGASTSTAEAYVQSSTFLKRVLTRAWDVLRMAGVRVHEKSKKAMLSEVAR